VILPWLVVRLYLLWRKREWCRWSALAGSMSSAEMQASGEVFASGCLHVVVLGRSGKPVS
jgi:hypothetical protein